MRPRNPRPKARLASVAVAATLALIPACSGGIARAPYGATVSVTLKDFRITASSPTVAAGGVQFRIHNNGPSTHEFVVVKTDYPDEGLPLASDGLTIDEKAPGVKDVGELDEVPLGASRTLVLQLRPGSYVLFCNLEGHYLGGMALSLKVP